MAAVLLASAGGSGRPDRAGEVGGVRICGGFGVCGGGGGRVCVGCAKSSKPGRKARGGDGGGEREQIGRAHV